MGRQERARKRERERWGRETQTALETMNAVDKAGGCGNCFHKIMNEPLSDGTGKLPCFLVFYFSPLSHSFTPSFSFIHLCLLIHHISLLFFPSHFAFFFFQKLIKSILPTVPLSYSLIAPQSFCLSVPL